MKTIRRGIQIVGFATFLAAAMPAHPAAADFNDEYVFASTKAVNRMDANPALKVTLYPVTLLVDTAFLPFAVIAGFVTG